MPKLVKVTYWRKVQFSHRKKGCIRDDQQKSEGSKKGKKYESDGDIATVGVVAKDFGFLKCHHLWAGSVMGQEWQDGFHGSPFKNEMLYHNQT